MFEFWMMLLTFSMALDMHKNRNQQSYEDDIIPRELTKEEKDEIKRIQQKRDSKIQSKEAKKFVDELKKTKMSKKNKEKVKKGYKKVSK